MTKHAWRVLNPTTEELNWFYEQFFFAVWENVARWRIAETLDGWISVNDMENYGESIWIEVKGSDVF